MSVVFSVKTPVELSNFNCGVGQVDCRIHAGVPNAQCFGRLHVVETDGAMKELHSTAQMAQRWVGPVYSMEFDCKRNGAIFVTVLVPLAQLKWAETVSVLLGCCGIFSECLTIAGQSIACFDGTTNPCSPVIH